MRGSLRLKRLTYATMALIALAIGTANADDLPDYMKPIAGRTASTPAETATKNVLALNSSMFELYGEAAKSSKRIFSPTTQSSSAFFPERAGVSFYIGPVSRRSMRRRCRSSIN